LDIFADAAQPSGLFVLVCLHLLIEDHALYPFAIPLLIISVLRLFVIVFRHVFADLTDFIVMTSISALMLTHIGILTPLRYFIDRLFSDRHVTGNNGNG
jgi:hypothetical protein